MDAKYWDGKQLEIIVCMAKNQFKITKRQEGVDAILQQIAPDQKEADIKAVKGAIYPVGFRRDAIEAIRNAEIGDK